MSDAPIQNIDQIDIIGKRTDGGVDLFIVASSYLDGSPATEHLFRTKIQNYFDAIYSEDLEAEFGLPEHVPYAIVVKCSERPNERIFEVVAEVAPVLAEYFVKLRIET